VLSALILLEGAGVAAAAIYLVVEIFAAPAVSIASAVALAVVVALAAVALILLARGALQARPWIRGATVCLAVLQLLVAYSIIITREPTLGWVLVVPAAALLVVVFSPAVIRATARDRSEDEDDEDGDDGRTF
jgi:hypothetical protein